MYSVGQCCNISYHCCIFVTSQSFDIAGNVALSTKSSQGRALTVHVIVLQMYNMYKMCLAMTPPTRHLHGLVHTPTCTLAVKAKPSMSASLFDDPILLACSCLVLCAVQLAGHRQRNCVSADRATQALYIMLTVSRGVVVTNNIVQGYCRVNFCAY